MDLLSQANALAERFPKASLSKEALAFLEESAGPWVLGCSGGVDSVCLALLMRSLFPEKECVLAHYNHGLRGDASDGDAAFVEALAKGLGFECMIERAERAIVGGSDASEAVLRAERFAFFENVLSLKGSQTLLLAHQADDVAETLLMRVARGSGLTGLCAPRPVHNHSRDPCKNPLLANLTSSSAFAGRTYVSDRLTFPRTSSEANCIQNRSASEFFKGLGNGHVRVRPLLCLAREAIEKACKELNISWREDGSNFSDDYFRNRVRHRALPALKEAAPTQLLPNVLHTRTLLEEDDTALEAWVDELFDGSLFSGPLELSPLKGRPKALCRRVLYRWLHAHKQSLTRVLFEKILEALTGNKDGMWSIGRDALVTIQAGCLSLELTGGVTLSWEPRGLLAPGGCVCFPDGSCLRAERVPLTDTLLSHVLEGGVDPNAEAYLAPQDGIFYVRAQRPGDRFHPLGAPGSKKLQDCFVDKKVPAALRPRLPLVISQNGEILWCKGFPPCEKSRLEPGMSYALRLTYHTYGC